MKKDIYLTDEQYGKLLEKIKVAVSENTQFKVMDSTDIGNKYTTSNVGLCNDGFTELDTALFPEQFLEYGRQSMKYTKIHHICPFDRRLEHVEKDAPVNFSNGCYYTCSLKKKRNDKENLFRLVDKAKELLQTGTSKERIEALNTRYFNRA